MDQKKILIALPFGQTIRDVLRSDTYSKCKCEREGSFNYFVKCK